MSVMQEIDAEPRNSLDCSSFRPVCTLHACLMRHSSSGIRRPRSGTYPSNISPGKDHLRLRKDHEPQQPCISAMSRDRVAGYGKSCHCQAMRVLPLSCRPIALAFSSNAIGTRSGTRYLSTMIQTAFRAASGGKYGTIRVLFRLQTSLWTTCCGLNMWEE
jgi:hypothetical protein